MKVTENYSFEYTTAGVVTTKYYLFAETVYMAYVYSFFVFVTVALESYNM